VSVALNSSSLNEDKLKKEIEKAQNLKTGQKGSSSQEKRKKVNINKTITIKRNNV
jgi:hypothetical protein